MEAMTTGPRVWRPRQKPFKVAAVKAGMFLMGSALESAAVLDEDVRREVEAFKDPWTVVMQVLPKGPSMVIQKKDGKLRYMGSNPMDADMTIYFKNLECAFLCFSAQIGTPRGYAEHRMTLQGDASQAMGLIRALNIVQAYLFPKIITRRLAKRVPPMTPRKWAIRAAILGAGIPFGLRKLYKPK